MMSKDINLPITRRPVFPDRCPICEKPGINDVIRLSGGRGILGWFAPRIAGRHIDVAIPAHTSCRRTFTLLRQLQAIVDIVAVFVIILTALMLLRLLAPGLTQPWRSIIALALGFGYMLLRGIWTALIRPPHVDITVYNTTITYEFRSRPYAAEFATLNPTNSP
ncbi:MAG: hypothetical protein MUE97_01075 [Phycisphaerales bacterium]|jgi:hypothetical protein|nr:hypothetical protein [Phycisphaerales bacterium]